MQMGNLLLIRLRLYDPALLVYDGNYQNLGLAIRIYLMA